MILDTLLHAQDSTVQTLHVLLLLHLSSVRARLPPHTHVGWQTIHRSQRLYVGPRTLAQFVKRGNKCLYPIC